MKSVISRAIALGIIVAPVAAAIPIASEAVAQRFTGVNGRNVDSATHARGRFAQTGPNEWTEFDLSGRATFHFTESNRDDWSVYLFDRSRNVQIQIDVHRGWIRYAPSGQQWGDLYQITGATARRGGGGWGGPGGPGGPGGGWGGATYSVQAGPIWNQRDAEVKCKRIADETGGRWTGQWSTVIQNRVSVCEIRWNRR